MNNLKARLKKIEPKKFEPVLVEWSFHYADERIERGQGTINDLDKALFGDIFVNSEGGEDAKRNIEQNKTP